MFYLSLDEVSDIIRYNKERWSFLLFRVICCRTKLDDVSSSQISGYNMCNEWMHNVNTIADNDPEQMLTNIYQMPN